MSEFAESGGRNDDASDVPPPKPPRPGTAAHPLTQMHNSSQQTMSSSNASMPRNNASGDARGSSYPAGRDSEKPPPPPPRRRAVPSVKSLSPKLSNHRNNLSANSDIDYEPLGPAALTPPASTMSGYIPSRTSTYSAASTPTGSPTLGAVNRKLEMWKTRLVRAHEALDRQGVQLYTWRRGQDVEAEAVGLVKKAMEEVERKKRQGGRR